MSSQRIDDKQVIANKKIETQNVESICGQSHSFKGNAFISQHVSLTIVHEIVLPRVLQTVRVNKIVNKNIGIVSAVSATTVVSQLGWQLFTQPLDISQQKHKFSLVQQPNGIQADNMMALSVQSNQRLQSSQKSSIRIIDSPLKQQSLKKQQSKASVPQTSPKYKISQKNKTKVKVDRYDSIQPIIKRQSAQIQRQDSNQAEFDILRNRILEKQKQIQKERLENQTKASRHIQQRISYDYQGKALKVQQKKRDNLVKKILAGSANMQVQKKQSEKLLRNSNACQSKTGIVATKIEVRPISKQKMQKGPKVKSLHQKKREQLQQQQRNIEIVFSDVNNLLDKAKFIDSESGKCRLTYERKSIESKRDKILSVQEMKKSMVSRKVNKDQYLRIKQLVNSKHMVQKSIKKPESQRNKLHTEGSCQLSATESKDRFSLQKQQKSQKLRIRTEVSAYNQNNGNIITHNDNLKSTLIWSPNMNQTEVALGTEIHGLSIKKQRQLGAVDQYNLLYMRNNGKVSKTNKKQSQTLTSNVIFPNLVTPHRSSIHIIPRNQRLKQSGAMVRQLRKNFEDKLRR